MIYIKWTWRRIRVSESTKINNNKKLKWNINFGYPVASRFPIRMLYPSIKISLYFTAHTNKKKFLFTSIFFPHWCCCCCFCHYWLCVILFALIQHDSGMVATMNSDWNEIAIVCVYVVAWRHRQPYWRRLFAQWSMVVGNDESLRRWNARHFGIDETIWVHIARQNFWEFLFILLHFIECLIEL